MSNEVFDGPALAEKLSKLNNSQQSIESLSRWCISCRKKAKPIVETWDKFFNSSQREQRISFLYLANDILQNSRRKGSEFVNEFWKVLPGALKLVYENGDEHGKKVATRLVDIWEERKVFGSRGQSLKDEILGKIPPTSVSQVKSSNPIKIVKRDAHSVRIKLSVGDLPEKIITAFQSVLDEHVSEEAAIKKCSTALQYVGKIEEDVENASTQGNQQGSGYLDELQEQENLLIHCIEKLENAEATRVLLVSQLKEALQEQESELVHIRTQLQAARCHIEQASNIRKKTSNNAANHTAEAMKGMELNQSFVQSSSTQSHPLAQATVSFAPLKANDEESKKARAAAVAARLAASTSSAQMLSSVLSSLVAEEAASMSGSLTSGGLTPGIPLFPSEKRQKLEKPMSVPDASNADIGSTGYFTLPQQSVANMPLTPSSGMQSLSQGKQMQSTFSQPPPLPLLPVLHSPATPSHQYVQSTGLMSGVMPFGYGSNTLPPPPPLPLHFGMGLPRPNPQSQQQPQPHQSPQQQQQQLQPANGGFYRPPGIGFYGQNHQPTTPPVHRQ
uniref:CID domain-containing protein n=1 Tax=Cannabis sativa TaxID=3483 RepID=A0A803R9N0_CANSA